MIPCFVTFGCMGAFCGGRARNTHSGRIRPQVTPKRFLGTQRSRICLQSVSAAGCPFRIRPADGGCSRLPVPPPPVIASRVAGERTLLSQPPTGDNGVAPIRACTQPHSRPAGTLRRRPKQGRGTSSSIADLSRTTPIPPGCPPRTGTVTSASPRSRPRRSMTFDIRLEWLSGRHQSS